MVSRGATQGKGARLPSTCHVIVHGEDTTDRQTTAQALRAAADGFFQLFWMFVAAADVTPYMHFVV
jgi:hypothetical protein